MTVRVLMKRTVQDINRLKLYELLRRLRAVALESPGYISGETLVSADLPGTSLVISTWENIRAWQAYEDSPGRSALLDEVGKLLLGPAETTIWVVEAVHE